MRSEARMAIGEARELETSRRFRGECNGCENECQGVASESSRQAVPILVFAFPKRSWRKHLYSTFAITIINVTFYFSVYIRFEREVSSLHNSWNCCSLLLRNDLKRPEIGYLSWGACPQTLVVGALCAHLYAPRNSGTPPANFCLRPCNHQLDKPCVKANSAHVFENEQIQQVFEFLIPLLVYQADIFSGASNANATVDRR